MVAGEVESHLEGCVGFCFLLLGAVRAHAPKLYLSPHNGRYKVEKCDWLSEDVICAACGVSVASAVSVLGIQVANQRTQGGDVCTPFSAHPAKKTDTIVHKPTAGDFTRPLSVNSIY